MKTIKLRPKDKDESWGAIEIKVYRETDEYWFGPTIKNAWVSMTWNKSTWMQV